ncbi:hypothetical protein [Oscillatoria sp. FACHB-1406]|uniref:hypothetical protein n=1 Tax=Oscillatoria sp. FACHB-1406 TaxID=2692846 RepID=UPI0016839C40|nr:hypothetical protein [Oscillatoria sp. FACHB-1406]MBD2578073.1 hypothetical protein [Oscillatoria sp. FACHB-1406]
MNEDSNLISNSNLSEEEMLDEYDFSQAVRRNSRQSLEGRTIRIETENGDRFVQIRTIETIARVNDDGRVTLQLSPEIAPGEYQITLLIQEQAVDI